METISFGDFLKVELCVGRIVNASVFADARKPAYILHVDFGDELGTKKSSAQVTALYEPEDLIGKLVVAVVNFPKKQIESVMSLVANRMSLVERIPANSSSVTVRPKALQDAEAPAMTVKRASPGRSTGQKTAR